MEKTIKQIADNLGISKQRVYRYVHQNHISDVHQRNGVMYLDDTVVSLIFQYFTEIDHISDVHHDVHQNRISDTVDDTVVDTLIKQLETKDTQIQDLTNQLDQSQKLLAQEQRLLDQEQQLHLATKQELQLLLEAPKEPKGGFFGLFRRKE